jgi:hypothetical protein
MRNSGRPSAPAHADNRNLSIVPEHSQVKLELDEVVSKIGQLELTLKLFRASSRHARAHRRRLCLARRA